MQVTDLGRYKQVFKNSEDFLSSREGAYIFATFEERSIHFDIHSKQYSGLKFIEIHELPSEAAIKVCGSDKLPIGNLSIYDGLIKQCENIKVYLDITGMTHSVWAPLIKRFLEEDIDFAVVYVEPDKYIKSPSPTGGEIYDLSEKTDGIKPIPGFASFPPEDDDFIFVPILGFEGPRFSYMVENIQPIASRIFPVIGVPGFRAEYPFFTYHGNRLTLKDTKSWRNVIFAKASCPFSLFYELLELSEKYNRQQIKIGLIGTKPHALGSILFRLAKPKKTEIIYDHPVRKLKRTEGAYTKYVYEVKDFFNSFPENRDLISKGRLR